MPRIDDYKEAKRIAAEMLASESFDIIMRRSSFEAKEKNIFRIPFLNRIYFLSFPDFEFTSEDGKDVPIQEQVLILHYMTGGETLQMSRNWIAYREIPGASFYFSAFVKRAIDPLKKVFGNQKDLLIKAGMKLNAKKIDAGNAGLEFRPFPKVPVQIILWEGDEEFPADANILFEDTVGNILSPEDAAWLAGMIVYRLMALSI